jgi:hypothetical protein
MPVNRSALSHLLAIALQHHPSPWAELFADYNVLRGRVWLFVLVTTALAPFVAGRAHGLWGQMPP